ncbi:hypothetical protein NDU88_004238, partial [Pleurodeles waltl]
VDVDYLNEAIEQLCISIVFYKETVSVQEHEPAVPLPSTGDKVKQQLCLWGQEDVGCVPGKNKQSVGTRKGPVSVEALS